MIKVKGLEKDKYYRYENYLLKYVGTKKISDAFSNHSVCKFIKIYDFGCKWKIKGIYYHVRPESDMINHIELVDRKFVNKLLI